MFLVFSMLSFAHEKSTSLTNIETSNSCAQI